MSLRPFLKPFSVIPGGNLLFQVPNQMAGNLVGIPSAVNQISMVGYQFIWTGTPTGSFGVQFSSDYSLNCMGNVQNAGTWTTLTLGSTLSATGAAGSGGIDIDQISFAWLRPTWTSTATATQTIMPVADSSGSLASKYFLIQDTLGNKYAIWFKVSGTGTAPTVAGYTNVEQDISTNATAATIGAALATTIAGLNSSGSFTTAGTTTVTVTNQAAGPFVLASDVNTGFAFAGGTGSGLLTCYVCGKVS